VVWFILLAHFLADYPLQLPWILRNKRQTAFVAVHASFHLVIMLALVGSERNRLWPYLATLAGVHFLIDVGKNLIYRLRPKWVVVPYVVDQIIHYLTIWISALWIQRTLGTTIPPLDPRWAIYAVAYLVVGYVWFISERIMTYNSPSYQEEVQAQYWPRMLSRAGLLTAILAVTNLNLVPGLALAIVPSIPYVSGRHRLRALITDLAVVWGIWIFIRIAL